MNGPVEKTEEDPSVIAARLLTYPLEALEVACATLRAVRANGAKLSDPEVVRDYLVAMHPSALSEDQERFYVIGVNVRLRPIFCDVVANGGLSSCPVEPREVFRRAIAEGAHALILAHNHPSGDPTPSREDNRLTGRLALAGQVVGIEVVNHIIVGANGTYYSRREAGGMDEFRKDAAA